MKRAAVVVMLFPFLAAFGPGNCAPDVDFDAERQAAGVSGVRFDADALLLTVPSGVAVVLQCDQGCNSIDITSEHPEVAFAARTSIAQEFERDVGVIVGLQPGVGRVGVLVGDLFYDITVQVTAPPRGRSGETTIVIPIDPSRRELP